MRLSINSAEMRSIAEAATKRELRLRARQVVNRAKILAPVKTGFLRSTIRPEEHFASTPLRIDIVATANYAEDVHNGTPPHVIRPRRAQVAGRRGPFLKFQVGGRTVYARQVHHPGTRARPFLSRALAEVAAAQGWTVRNFGPS